MKARLLNVSIPVDKVRARKMMCTDESVKCVSIPVDKVRAEILGEVNDPVEGGFNPRG